MQQNICPQLQFFSLECLLQCNISFYIFFFEGYFSNKKLKMLGCLVKLQRTKHHFYFLLLFLNMHSYSKKYIEYKILYENNFSAYTELQLRLVNKPRNGKVHRKMAIEYFTYISVSILNLSLLLKTK